ncbi:DUF6270 domain-containing protein [Fredinandcohnia sp. FSL W7-1320]|uniref:DUF6270 domain-containing protein n=1 Tax=Fredinandcohnia sp. FSL W7-1320 TaxID=2954540 RepID=UPI0030FD3108
MLPINVAVLGSCVTRDVFNSKFIENYKKYYDCVVTQNQTSIISLMSDPVDFDEKDIDNQADAYSISNVKSELTKENLQKLKETQPKYILLDFSGDIRFGVIKISENQFITNNRWKVRKTTFFKKLSDVQVFEINTDKESYIELWKRSVDRLFDFFNKELPNTKIIVHKTRNTDYAINEDGSLFKLSESGKMKAENVKELNKTWSTLNDYVVQKYNTFIIDMTDRYYLSYTKHPWGPFYTHFTMDYYQDFFQKLNQITIKDNPEILTKIIEDMYKEQSELTKPFLGIIDENNKLNREITERGMRVAELELGIEKLIEENEYCHPVDPPLPCFYPINDKF